MNTIDELIKTIVPNRANFQYCMENQIINGSLYVSIERIMKEYAKQYRIENDSLNFVLKEKDLEISLLKSKIEELQEDLINKQAGAPWMQ